MTEQDQLEAEFSDDEPQGAAANTERTQSCQTTRNSPMEEDFGGLWERTASAPPTDAGYADAAASAIEVGKT
ncbi:hypothetical protein DMENIID0001_140340 [Sergentomyia squamirostris]